MSLEAPLRVTVEIRLLDGPAAGQRRFRLCHHVELPPTLTFESGLPLEGEGRGEVSFRLPGGTPVQARALLRFDPEHPERGSEAALLDLPPDLLQTLEGYITDFLQG